METNDLRMVEENFQFDIRASGILWNEETGYETEIVRLLDLIETTFSIEGNTDKAYQQINFVYLLKHVAHSDRHKIVASEEKVRPVWKHRKEVKNVKPTMLNENIAEFPSSVRFEVSFD